VRLGVSPTAVSSSGMRCADGDVLVLVGQRVLERAVLASIRLDAAG
jgi:hypothetical protein